MNVINVMDNSYLAQPPQRPTPADRSPPRAELHIIATPPVTPDAPTENSSNIMNNNNNNIGAHISSTTLTGSGKLPSLKRSFDVAFLMMPDERIKQKQQLVEKQARSLDMSSYERHQYITDLSQRCQQLPLLLHTSLPQPSELFQLHDLRRQQSPRIYDDPSVVLPPSSHSHHIDVGTGSSLPVKSAFTKVASSSSLPPHLVEQTHAQPAPSLSPDRISCSSISPPLATTPPRTNSSGNGSLSNGSSGSAASLSVARCLNQNAIVYQSFRPEYQFNGAASFQTVNHMQALQAHRIKQQLLYRPPGVAVTSNSASATTANTPTTSAPHHTAALNSNNLAEFLPTYPSFCFNPNGPHFNAVPSPELPRIVQNPAAAAILSTLIPPTLASTFTLTAQNVCAKCNISFRMTSDLVYHMRSHHKNEVACDPNRRKREEKLRCPVCQESFRERHHLTRHMTAHQDKESDRMQPLPTSNSAMKNSASNDNVNVIGLSNAGGKATSMPVRGSPTGRQLSGVSATCGPK